MLSRDVDYTMSTLAASAGVAVRGR